MAAQPNRSPQQEVVVVDDQNKKKLIEEVSGWLRVFDDGSVDRTWRGPPEVKFLSDPVPPHEHQFIDGVATRDLTIHHDDLLQPNYSIKEEDKDHEANEEAKENSSNLRVRIYLPGPEEEEQRERLPVIVHLHGGGFCISQADWFMYYAAYTHLARSAHAIVVSVYLPLAPEHPLPAAIDHSYRALLWLASLARADQYDPWFNRADFTRVFLVGDSSGGNLVHHVAARARSPRGQAEIGPALRVAGAVPIHPGFCREERSRSELEMPQTPFLTLEMADKFIALALPQGSTKDHPFTCPHNHTAAPALEEAELPPVMLCVADKDLMLDAEMEYYEAMKKAQKEIEVFVSEGMTHSFYLNRIAVANDPNTRNETHNLFRAIVDFINRH